MRLSFSGIYDFSVRNFSVSVQRYADFLPATVFGSLYFDEGLGVGIAVDPTLDLSDAGEQAVGDVTAVQERMSGIVALQHGDQRRGSRGTPFRTFTAISKASILTMSMTGRLAIDPLFLQCLRRGRAILSGMVLIWIDQQFGRSHRAQVVESGERRYALLFCRGDVIGPSELRGLLQPVERALRFDQFVRAFADANKVACGEHGVGVLQRPPQRFGIPGAVVQHGVERGLVEPYVSALFFVDAPSQKWAGERRSHSTNL